MMIRLHRGSFDDSQSTMAEIEPTESAVLLYLSARWGQSTTGVVKVAPYVYDPRIKWDTHVVTLNGDVVAFTDGPLLVSEAL